MIQRHRLRIVFVDSSVLFAAALSPNGSARDLVEAGFRREIILAISEMVLLETERNLAAKAPRGLDGFTELRDAGVFQIAFPERSLVLEVAQHVEPKDAAIVAGALVVNAEAFATYDRKHLLKHSEQLLARHGLTVATPDHILAKLGA